MPTFNFVARDHLGRNLHGSLTGATEQAVFSKLNKLGYVVLSVNEQEGKEKIPLFADNINISDIVIFTKLLGKVVESGINVVDALSAIEEQTTNTAMKKTIRILRQDVERGSTLTQAFERHPKVFPPLIMSMISSGEASGTISVALERTSQYLEQDMDLRRSIGNAFIYPKIVLAVAFAGIMLLLRLYIPAIAKVYAQVPNMKLPTFTRILLAVSGIVEHQWIALLVSLGMLIMAFYFFKNSAATRKYYDAMVLSMPVSGNLNRRVLVARAIHTLGSMLSSGVPLIASLESVKMVSDNYYIQKDIDSVLRSVQEGGTISSPLRMSKNFPPIVTHMISAGEHSGKLPDLLLSCSQVLEKEIVFLVKRALIILEPAITIFISLVVFFIAVAFYLPLAQFLTLIPK